MEQPPREDEGVANAELLREQPVGGVDEADEQAALEDDGYLRRPGVGVRGHQAVACDVDPGHGQALRVGPRQVPRGGEGYVEAEGVAGGVAGSGEDGGGEVGRQGLVWVGAGLAIDEDGRVGVCDAVVMEWVWVG